MLIDNDLMAIAQALAPMHERIQYHQNEIVRLQDEIQTIRASILSAASPSLRKNYQELAYVRRDEITQHEIDRDYLQQTLLSAMITTPVSTPSPNITSP